MARQFLSSHANFACRWIPYITLQFIELCKMPQVDVLGKLSVSNRDDRGLVQVMPSCERYFGEELRKTAPKGTGAFLMSQSQHLVMELYESRIARLVELNFW